MSIITVILRKLANFFKCFVIIFKKIFSICKGRSRVGELPLYNNKSNENSISHDIFKPGLIGNQNSMGSWNNWNDQSFGIESKIEEYRSKRLASSEKETKEDERDYFQEMQPKIKAPTELKLLDAFKQKHNNSVTPQKNLFEVKEDFVDIRNSGNTLGDLELEENISHQNDGAAWDVDMDLATVDDALREATKRERDQIRQKRQQDHENRRFQQKQKSRSSNSTSISIS